jgi:hypothetical protein
MIMCARSLGIAVEIGWPAIYHLPPTGSPTPWIYHLSRQVESIALTIVHRASTYVGQSTMFGSSTSLVCSHSRRVESMALTIVYRGNKHAGQPIMRTTLQRATNCLPMQRNVSKPPKYMSIRSACVLIGRTCLIS